MLEIPAQAWEWFRRSYIWRSLFRQPYPRDERSRRGESALAPFGAGIVAATGTASVIGAADGAISIGVCVAISLFI